MTEQAYWLPLFTYVSTYAFTKQLEMKTFPTSCRASLREVEVAAGVSQRHPEGP